MRYRSSVPSAMLSGPTRDAQITLACVCTTAFGREVVPEVNMIPTGSIGSAGRSGSAAPSPREVRERDPLAPPSRSCAPAAGSPLSSAVTTIHFRCFAFAATSATYCGCVIAATQRAWPAKYSISGPALCVLVVTPTAPSRAQRVPGEHHLGAVVGVDQHLVALADAAPREAGGDVARLARGTAHRSRCDPRRRAAPRSGTGGRASSSAQWRSSQRTSCPAIW